MDSIDSHATKTPGSWRWWYWAALPLAAVAAYSLVLRVGFLADDFVFLGLSYKPGVDFRALLPGSDWFFYRPVGVLFTWELGWYLWGYNPLPYHLIQLILHATVSLVLGLWLAYMTGRKGLGWLAGMFFAVFPLHAEAVGWIAAQWDVMGTLFGLLSLWSFTAWWRTGRTGQSNQRLYWASVLMYGLAILDKESFITFVAVLGIAVWLVAAPSDRREWGRLGFSLLPFFALVGLNIALRYLIVGSLGSYVSARYDFGEFIWNYSAAYLSRLLAPINPAIFGNATVQIVGLLSSAALAFGLAWFGRPQRRLLLLAGAWIALTLLPVINLPGATSENLRDSRLLYLPAIGYCIVLATLLYTALAAARRHRPILLASIVTLLTLSSVVAWIQTTPWYMATRQADEIVSEFFGIIPVQTRPNGMVWFVENIPLRYKGASLLPWGLGNSRVLINSNAVHPKVERVQDATQAPITGDSRDAYAVRLRFDEGDQLWHVDYAAGVTAASEPPGQSQAGKDLKVWDFRRCTSQGLGGWQVFDATERCEPGRGLVLQPTSPDPRMLAPKLLIEQLKNKARFVRLRVAVRYAGSESKTQPLFSEWFWRSLEVDYTGEWRRTLPLKQDGQPHVYWTYIPSAEVSGALSGLRFDPVNAPFESEIQWIAFDTLPPTTRFDNPQR